MQRARVAAAAATTTKGSQRHVCILGGGIQGASAAYHLTKRGCRVTMVELEKVASAASGKAGGFLARDWGSGATAKLHTESFRMHKELAEALNLETFREIDTLSVTSGKGSAGLKMTSWLDGSIRQARLLDKAGATAQVTPLELTTKLAEAASQNGAEIVIGRATGIVSDSGASEADNRLASAVEIELQTGEREVVACTDVLVAMGVWSTLTAPWFGLPETAWPITGIKSTHVVWAGREAIVQEPAALFCGQETNGTHLELYPRSNGDMYACGIGGSDYVDDPQRLAVGGGERLELDASNQSTNFTDSSPSPLPSSLLCRLDCDKPSSVSADLSRVKAANESAGKLSTILRSAPDHVGACMRPCPPDAMVSPPLAPLLLFPPTPLTLPLPSLLSLQPFMGRVTGFANAYISAGHNCWGILWGPVSGLLMAELICDGKATTADVRPFSPSRFLPRDYERGNRGRKMGSQPIGEQW